MGSFLQQHLRDEVVLLARDRGASEGRVMKVHRDAHLPHACIDGSREICRTTSSPRRLASPFRADYLGISSGIKLDFISTLSFSLLPIYGMTCTPRVRVEIQVPRV